MTPQIKHPPVIDISHWIDVPDFRVLSPMPWLILTKATQGTWLLDAQYAEYADQIREAGIRLGAYHFMEPGDEIAQADWFCEIVLTVGLRGNEVLACDMEMKGISLVQIKRFLDRVHSKTGIRPILYSTQLMLEALYTSILSYAWLRDEWLWIAEYPDNPDPYNEIPDWIVPRGCLKERTALWQYSDDGILGGIPGNNVDLNLINPFYAQAIGLTEPNGGSMPYNYSITPLFPEGSAVRPYHDTDNAKLPSGLPYDKLAFGNTKWIAPADKFNALGVKVNQAGDIWLEVVEVNGVTLAAPAWIAEIHLGKRYATISQIGIPVPPPSTTLPDLPVAITLGDDVTYAKQTVNITLKPK